MILRSWPVVKGIFFWVLSGIVMHGRNILRRRFHWRHLCYYQWDTGDEELLWCGSTTLVVGMPPP